ETVLATINKANLTDNGDGTYTFNNTGDPSDDILLDFNASSLPYNNTDSGITSTNLQDAIDEVVTMISEAGGGTVTSVGLTVPTGLSVSGSPITSSGTLAVTYSSGYQGYTTAESDKLANEVIEKSSEQWNDIELDGVGGDPILINIDTEARFLNITDNTTSSSLGGYTDDGGSIPTSIFWSGMTVKVHNATGSDQVIKHNYSSAAIKFLFPKEEDYIIKPNETVTFTYRGGALELESTTTIVKDYINILDFGAVGNGTTESAEFIQNALDYAESNGIRRVYAPAGEYLLEKTIYIPTEIEFYGDGMDKTSFKIDEETILDTIGMFAGATHYQNFYTPAISTKTTRTGATLNNIL